MKTTRTDADQILTMLTPGQRVLDLGCGDGHLLSALIKQRQCQAQGVEINPSAVMACLAKGLPVYQGDLETSLADYADRQFDVVVLNQTLQATHQPVRVLQEMLRVGSRAIVGFPNFGHWEIRLKLLTSGRMPSSKSLPFAWYDTPNIHLFTLLDFRTLCQEQDVTITRNLYQIAGQWMSAEPWPQAANWLATHALFEITRN